jgi:hypothetical protein
VVGAEAPGRLRLGRARALRGPEGRMVPPTQRSWLIPAGGALLPERGSPGLRWGGGREGVSAPEVSAQRVTAERASAVLVLEEGGGGETSTGSAGPVALGERRMGEEEKGQENLERLGYKTDEHHCAGGRAPPTPALLVGFSHKAGE